MEFRVRKYFKPLVHATALLLTIFPVSPNFITSLSFLFAVGAFYFFQTASPILAGFFIFLNGFIDGVDGELARITDRKTNFGGFFDSVLDRYSDSVIILGASISIGEPFLGFFTVLGFIMVSYTRAVAEKMGHPCDVGLGARSERLLILILSILIGKLYYGLIFVCVVANLTAAYRMYYFYNITRLNRNT